VRLRTWADAHGTDMDAARRRVVYERLLARMDAVAPLQWVVRGSRAIDLRFGGRARRTFDLDVSMADAPPIVLDQVRQMLLEICQADLADGWSIRPTRLQRSLVRGIGVVGFKAWLSAAHDGQPFGEFPVDVSKTQASSIRPDVLSVPGMLTGAELRVVVVRPEVQIAEKVHAFTRPYATDKPRARSYDLVDAVALVLAAEPDLAVLRTAAEQTFRHRGTHALPSALNAVPPEWATAFRVHGEGYWLTRLPTRQGVAILSAVWERAMGLPAGAQEVG
jgi:hypothetical protein